MEGVRSLNAGRWMTSSRRLSAGSERSGVILEVVVQGVERFNVQQKTEIADLSFVKENLERLLQENEHFSLYLFPFTTKCQINTWNRTSQEQSFLGTVREFLSISMDALLAAWFGNLVAYTGLFPALSSLTHSIKKGSNLVLESSEAFNRTIYHLHQELEFTVLSRNHLKPADVLSGFMKRCILRGCLIRFSRFVSHPRVMTAR